jgi:WD40-like Beta Propeller Repeat
VRSIAASALVAVLLVSGLPGASLSAPAQAQQAEAEQGLLAVVGRQVAWLNLEAPRHRMVTRLASNGNALEVTAQRNATHAVVSVAAPFEGGGMRGADLLALDLATGETQPLLQRSDPRESLNSPAWWPDESTLLFERQDLGGKPVGAPGQEVSRYPSRIERVMLDGSGREPLGLEGRQPSAAPDGTRLVFARTTNTGASLLMWNQTDGSIQTLVPEGRFADVAYPNFSAGSDRVAFVAPESGLGLTEPRASLLGALFGPTVAYAHGIPWDPWIINTDGTGLHRVAETGGDEPSVAWSPDSSQLFVYSGTGSFLVDVASGSLTPLLFVQGYGPVIWLPVS